jgi:hypothetical protein
MLLGRWVGYNTLCKSLGAKLRPCSCRVPHPYHRISAGSEDGSQGVSGALKADPYGRDSTSPIARPDTPGGATLPPRTLPPGIVKPIPVNTRSVEQELNKILRANEPKLTRWLYSTWNANADAIKDQEIDNAIRDGQINQQWVDRWQRDYADMINARLAPLWLDTLQTGGNRLIQGLTDAGLEPSFQLLGDRFSEWTRARAADFVVDITDSQRSALNAMLHRFTVVEPMAPATLARFIRPVIGLTNNEAGVAGRLYQELLDKGLSPSKAAAQASRKTAFLRRRRATRIARTELAYAYNFGSFLAVKDAVDEGVLDTNEVMVKRWWTQKDERVCPFCGPLHGQVVGIEETFPGLTKRVPNTFVPPAHPMCRCVVLYEIEVHDMPAEDPQAQAVQAAEANPHRAMGQFNDTIQGDNPIDAFDPALWTDEQTEVVNAISLYTEANVDSVVDPSKFNPDARKRTTSKVGDLAFLQKSGINVPGDAPAMTDWLPDQSREAYTRAHRVMASLSNAKGVPSSAGEFGTLSSVHDRLLDSWKMKRGNVIARGIALDDELINTLIEAHEADESMPFNMRAISSWSTSGDVAERFAGEGLDLGQSKVVFFSDRSRGTYIAPMSGFKREKEWMAGGFMEIEDMRVIRNVTYVKAKFIEQAKQMKLDTALRKLGEAMQGRPKRPRKPIAIEGETLF